MEQSTELQPSFEDVFNILSQVPQDKLLSLKHKLKHLIPGPSSKLLQAMVLLSLGQDTDARICLDALRDNPAAQYVHQTKLGAAGTQEDGEDVQPPQLDAGAMALLAQVYKVLAQEKLCSPEAWDKACQAATRACQDTQRGMLNNIPPEDQDKQGFAPSMGPSDRFWTLRSDEDTGFLRGGSSDYVVRSSPVPIGGNSELSAPRTLCSTGSCSLPSCLEVSASPTVVCHSHPSPPEGVPQPSGAGHPDGDTQSPQESSWTSSPSSHPGQDTGAQVPRPEEVLQGSSCHPVLPVPSEGAVIQPAQSSDIPSTVTEPPAPRENRDEKQDEKQLPTGLPDPGAAVGTDPAHISIGDSDIPAGIPCNSTSASISTCSLPPPPSCSFSSTLPPLQEPPSNLNPPPLRSSPSPAWPPPSLPAVDPVSLSEPDGGKFFTFVVLHASEDEIVAQRVKNRLESMGVSNGATLCEDFSVAGRSRMGGFLEAMENSAFTILLLTRNFMCNLCLFQTDTALMQSIQDPSKHYSVIPFLPKENALEQGQIPRMLSALVTLDESSPLFPRVVSNTFNPKKISQKKAMWEQMQRRKLQLRWERQQAQQNLAALSLGRPSQVFPAATRPWPPEPSPQQWCPPNNPFAGHPPPAQMGPPNSQPLLPPGHYNILPGPGGIVIQNARMVQIGDHNTMQVETVPPGPQDSEGQTRHRV
ncbi:PREDICTED: TIR domain-containing adapter molecule 1 [Lepidothrix coronata]|uniref:TIR domain-containing adapter molecule 1 n=1 Tax=Lepidothrix coronata TaxID=321398 RepID=A0A6J0IR32_9PASS|nr:PREDICTED: TIR domain-containing adapter molecule 1 [Lepidothrix coronata]XP_017689118.1 PREDICTED: TIR domain-containing adapter molecule 1 [Lepidothrix coronata]